MLTTTISKPAPADIEELIPYYAYANFKRKGYVLQPYKRNPCKEEFVLLFILGCRITSKEIYIKYFSEPSIGDVLATNDNRHIEVIEKEWA